MISLDQTDFTKQRTQIQAITLEVRTFDDNLLSEWTHEQPNFELLELPELLAGTSLTLLIYPEELSRNQTVKSVVHETINYSETLQPEASVEVWGHNPPVWTIKGHTGYATREINGEKVDGYMMFSALYNFFDNYYKENLFRLKNKVPHVKMLFCNWTDMYQDFWYVEPSGLPQKTRSSTKPLYYYYSVELIGVEPFINGEVVSDEIARAVSDFNKRLTQISKSLLEHGYEASQYKSYLPVGLRTSFDNLLKSVNEIAQKITKPIQDVKNFLGNVNATIKELATMEKKLVNAITSPVSPIFGCLHQLVQIKCGLRTLVKIPFDKYNTIAMNFKGLMNSLKNSGCGTTLKTTNSTSYERLL